MTQFFVNGITWTLGILGAALILAAKTSIEKLTSLYFQDWYAQYRAKRRD